MNWREWSSLTVAALLLTAIICALIWLGRLNELKAAEWASWVQAVGSIAAIFVAFWIAQTQQRKTARNDDDRKVREHFQKTQTLWTLANWAIGEMNRALDHAETDGAHGTSTFTPLRLDHEREMLEMFVTPYEPGSAAVALCFIHALWETRQNFDYMRGGALREHFSQVTLNHINDCNRHLAVLAHNKGALEAECRRRGIVIF